MYNMNIALAIENIIVSHAESFTINQIKKEALKYYDDEAIIDKYISETLDSYLNSGVVSECQGVYEVCI